MNTANSHRVLILFALLLVAGIGALAYFTQGNSAIDGAQTPTSTPAPAPAPTPTPAPTSTFCGGIAAFPCPSGYSCKLDGTYPDAGGHCVLK